MKAPKPASEQGGPIFPQGAMDPYVFEQFEGMNTATLRPGVDDKEAAWLDSFMPLGPGRNLRTMPGVGPALFGTVNQIIFFAFANIGSTPYCIVFGDTGSVAGINTTTGAITDIAPAGTIQNPSRLNIGLASYGNQFVLIVARQTDGYFIWDGTITYIPGDALPDSGGIVPLGIGGTAVEIYAGRVWIANGPTIYFSAPGSLTAFGTDGGGNFSSSDSFLRINFIGLKQSNGFLYLIADSSINYISGVQTSGSPPVTTFTNQNLDPEVGTPWPTTIEVFNRNIIFANSFGVHIGYGGAVSKVSEKLDGIYNTVTNFGSFIPSSAKAIVYGKKIWIILLPIIDPISGQQVNKMFCWNGKIWWAASQQIGLQYIATQEINSVLTAWTTDGNTIFPLFQAPSNGFTKIAQSRLWDRPGYELYKNATRFWGLFKYYSSTSSSVTINIDNENDSDQTSSVSTLNPLALVWTNNSAVAIAWVNNAANPILWILPAGGYAVSIPDAVGQNGALIGMTISTLSSDMAIVSAKLAPLVMGYRG